MDDIHTSLQSSEEDATWYKHKSRSLQRFLIEKGFTIDEFREYESMVAIVDREIKEMITDE